MRIIITETSWDELSLRDQEYFWRMSRVHEVVFRDRHGQDYLIKDFRRDDEPFELIIGRSTIDPPDEEEKNAKNEVEAKKG